MKTRIIVAIVSSLAAMPALAQTVPDPAGTSAAGQNAPALTGAPVRGPGRMRGGMGMLRMADTNGDGIVTRAEYQASVDARFARMDVNHDGVLSPDEMPMRGAWRGGRPGGANMLPPPNTASASTTGTSPAQAAVTNRPPETREQYQAAAMRRFDRLDTNHDGQIDAGEMAAMAQGRPMRGSMGDAPPAADR